MNKYISVVILVLSLLLSKHTYATVIVSNLSGGTGLWSASSTWDLGVVPGCYDTIHIVAGDHVNLTTTVNLNACSPVYLLIEGRLHFPNNGKNLLLPCDSYVDIPLGGSITAPGNDNSNKIAICGTFVWASNEPDINGPASFGVAPLPISLLSFEANINEDKVELKWVTASEINNDYFTIERSRDAKKWEELVTVEGAGSSTQLIEYFETDNEPQEGLSYYRLKQTDINGDFEYFNIVPVRYKKNNSGEAAISLFPNPVSPGETVQLRFENIYDSELIVVLRDVKGQEYYSKVVVNIEDGTLVGVPIDNSIPKGVYLVTASSENQMYSQKLIIK